MSFNDSFWSETDNDFSGFQVLSKRMKDAKHMYDELAEFLQRRIKVELQYGKDLAVLGKQVKQCSDTGSSRDAWAVVREQTAAQASVHTLLAEELRTNVAQPLDVLRERMRSERKQVEDSVVAAQKKKVTATENMVKKEKKYHTSCKDSDRMQREVNDMKGGAATAKEFDKASQKARKAKEAVQSSQEAYKDAVKMLDDTRRSWERDMSKCCKTYDRMEQQRLTQQRSMLWLTANIGSATAVEIDAKLEEIRKALEKVDVSQDLQDFIKVNSTGSVKPAPIQYRDFYDTSLAPATAKKSSRTSMGPPASAAVSRPPDNRPASLAGTGVASQRLLEASVAAPAAAPRTKSPEPAALSGPVWYKAAFAYMPQGPEELTLTAGEKVLVMDSSEADWWKAKKADGRQGMCPAAYLKKI